MTVIGVPKELKDHEYRVGLTPDSVAELVSHKHQVVIEASAGLAIGFSDQDYQNSGATVVADATAVFQQAQLIIKVKEPEQEEVHQFTAQHCLFTYLHLAPNPPLTDALCHTGATCIAYETVTGDSDQHLPLLEPMSEIAGRLSIQVAAHCLEMAQGGRGVLMAGATGVDAARILIVGGGTVGANAIQMALGLVAEVTVLDTSLARLRQLEQQFGPRLKTRLSTSTALQQQLGHSDVVIGAVLVPGSSAPKILQRHHVKQMIAGSVIVDVAIDQGGFAETSRPTSHSAPIFIEEQVIHYCVTNMPGAVARTSTLALNQATLPYILQLANDGLQQACQHRPGLQPGINILAGQLVHPAIASSQNRTPTAFSWSLLNS